MSRATFDTPTTSPAASLIGDAVTETSIGRPSFGDATRLKVLDAATRTDLGEDVHLLVRDDRRE